MTEVNPEEEFEFGDFDLLDDVIVTPESEALPYLEPVDGHQDELEGLGGPGNSPYNSEEALKRARQMCLDRTYVGTGMCLKTVRGYYGVNAKYLDAESSYYAADHKRPVPSGKDVPRGVPVYWTNGRYGHIAISMGGGLCYSTDWKEPGRVDVAEIDALTRSWGQNFRGYAWEVNDVIVWTPPKPVGTVSIKNLKPGQKHEDVKEVKKALYKKGYRGFWLKSDKWGRGIQKAYARYQRRLGYHGNDANGIPGPITLKKLGLQVKP